MATFAADDFSTASLSDIAGTSADTGGSWTLPTGFTQAIATSAAGLARLGANSGGSNRCQYIPTDPGTGDYDVTADFVQRNGTARPMGIGGRIQAGGSGCYGVVHNVASNLWELRLASTNSGAQTLLGSYSQTLTFDQVYAIKLEMRGSTIKVFVDGVERINVTDSTLSAGYAGLWSNGTAISGADNTGTHVDNLVASTPSTNVTATATEGWGLGFAVSPAVSGSALASPREGWGLGWGGVADVSLGTSVTVSAGNAWGLAWGGVSSVSGSAVISPAEGWATAWGGPATVSLGANVVVAAPDAWASGWGGPTSVIVAGAARVGPTVFASTSVRVGPDPRRSTSTPR